MATTLEKAKTAPLVESRHLPHLGKTRFDEIFRDMEEFWDRAMPFRFELFRRRPEMRMPDFDWSPRVDVYEKAGELMVRADLPGLKKEEMELFFEEGDLILKGERHVEEEKKEKDFYRAERMHGTFYRRIPLGFEIDPTLVKATFENGVLNLGIPMPPETKPAPKRIAIK
jgi:HSP20 family protein